ncbi:hypothetical protein GGX14DRAFT_577654 [Mycena pura]|uniref:Uncharacterized protein n=1 Tax=Mycena pura TaxID=153505 RepID=A0AAD6UVI5_9AGAR|nr:hypothetical protein GGX14DRAFT_577654 [Mycena pura]
METNWTQLKDQKGNRIVPLPKAWSSSAFVFFCLNSVQVTYQTVTVELSPEQQTLYDSVATSGKASLKQILDSSKWGLAENIIFRLRQVVLHPLLLPTDYQALAAESQVVGAAEPSANPAEPPTNNRVHSTPPGPHVEDLQALRAFQVLEAELETPLHRPLNFRNPPNTNDHFNAQEAQVQYPNTGLYALTNHKNNHVLVENEEHLYQLLDFALDLPHGRRRAQIVDRIHQGIEEAISEKQFHWEEQRLSVDVGRVVVYNNKHFARLPHWPPAVVAAMVTSAMMNHFFRVSRQGGTVLLAGIQAILNGVPGQISHPHLILRDP